MSFTLALGHRVHPIIPNNIDKGTRAQEEHQNQVSLTPRVQGHQRSFTSLCLFNYLTVFSVAPEKYEILKAGFLGHFRSCALIIPRGLGHHHLFTESHRLGDRFAAWSLGTVTPKSQITVGTDLSLCQGIPPCLSSSHLDAFPFRNSNPYHQLTDRK